MQELFVELRNNGIRVETAMRPHSPSAETLAGAHQVDADLIASDMASNPKGAER